MSAPLFGRIVCAVLGLTLSQMAVAQIVSPIGDIDPAAPGNQFLIDHEGSTREVNLFGRDPALPQIYHTGEARFEQVDGDLLGDLNAGTLLDSIAWRRDGQVLYPQDLQAVNRMVRVHLVVGLGTYNDFGQDFEGNFENSPYVPGPTSVIGTSQVYQSFSLPDLRNAPATVPAAFFVPFPFSTPFTIPGNSAANKDAVIWSLQVEDVLSGSYPLDAHLAIAAQSVSSNMGTGCIVGNNTYPMTLNVVGHMDPQVPSYTLNLDLDNAPISQPVTLLAGMTPQNVPLAGFCSNLYVVPMVVVGLMPTNSMGFSATAIQTQWLDFYEGQHLYFQAVTPDPQQLYPVPLAVSNAVDHRVVASGPKVKSLYSHMKEAISANNGVEYGYGLVVQFGTGGGQ